MELGILKSEGREWAVKVATTSIILEWQNALYGMFRKYAAFGEVTARI